MANNNISNLIICWGQAYTTTDTQGGWFSLPTTFTSNNYSVLLTHSYHNDYSTNIIFTETNRALTQFFVSCNTSGTMTFNYFVIGY